MAWYVYAIRKVGRGPGPISAPANVMVSSIAGVLLGIVPPRLRLEGQLDAFVLFFPVVHFVTTYIYLRFRVTREKNVSLR
jgi:hypothetical protein